MKTDWQSYGRAWPWVGGMAFGRRFFESGEMRLALLSLLGDGPKHGYQLMKDLEDRSGGLYKASAGSIYPTLQQLEDEDLIRSEQQDGKRVYSLTDAGRAELGRESERVRRIWERAQKWEEWGQYMHPEIFSVLKPMGGLMQAAWRAAGRASGKNDLEDRVREILDRARKELEQVQSG
jgi:DNA-binding PadR family transcriptional regulator